MNILTKLVTADPLTIEEFKLFYKREAAPVIEWNKLQGKTSLEVVSTNQQLEQFFTAWGHGDKPWYLVPKLTVKQAAEQKNDIPPLKMDHKVQIYRIPCIRYHGKKLLIDGNHRAVGAYKRKKGYCFIVDILEIKDPLLVMDFALKTL